MNRRIIRRITLWVVLGLVVLGCASPMFVTPSPATSVPGFVETVVFETAAAAQTQTALHIPPSSTPTFTPLPTKTITLTPSPTATVLLITETSVPADTLLEEGGIEEPESGGGSVGSGDSGESVMTDKEWTCLVISKSPRRDTVFSRGVQFNAVWTVQNTGTKTWPRQGVDIVYHTGADLHEGKPYRDIPATVGPGGKVTLTVAMTAPKKPGEYGTRWALMVGKKIFCSVRFPVTVK